MIVGGTRADRGYTLLELVVVVAILALAAMLVVPHVTGLGQRAKVTAADHDLATLRAAFLNPETGYLHDMRGIPGFSVGYLRLANILTATNLYVAVEDFDRGVETSGRNLHDADLRTFYPTGIAAVASFLSWNPETERGWRGPYVTAAVGSFPSRATRRFADDATAEARGFFPNLERLRLPLDFIAGKDGCSIYGFPGEPAVMDPWGNPYVLQIPPPQAFWDRYDANTNLAEDVRFAYARLVSAGPNGILETPCFSANGTNDWRITSWQERDCRISRQAGRVDGELARGDDRVLFLLRNDTDEGRSVR